MNKLKKLRQAHPVWYSALAAVLSIAFIMACGLSVGLVAGFTVPQADEYVLVLIQEGLAALLVYALARLSGRAAVLRQKGIGFGRGLLVGMYPLVLIFVAGAANIEVMLETGGADLAPAYRIAAFLGAMFLIGFTEELAFRGLVADTLLGAFGTSRAGVWKAAALSGVLFGAAHMTNLLGADPLGVFVQTAVASVLGMLFAAIYYRSGNLWVTIFLHAAMDTASLLAGGLFTGEGAGGGVGETISGYSLLNLTAAVTYLLPTLFLLRKKKLPQIQALWGQIESGAQPQQKG